MNYLQKQQITAVHNHYKRKIDRKILQNTTEKPMLSHIKCRMEKSKNHAGVKFFDEKL